MQIDILQADRYFAMRTTDAVCTRRSRGLAAGVTKNAKVLGCECPWQQLRPHEAKVRREAGSNSSGIGGAAP